MDTPSLTHHKQVIPVGTLFKVAYRRMKNRAKTLFSIAGIYALALILFGIFTDVIPKTNSALYPLVIVIIYIIYLVIGWWAGPAIVDGAIREDNAPFSSVARNGLRYAFPFIGIALVGSWMILGGFIAFGIPGIAIMTQLIFASAIYVHKKTKIMESLRLSRLLVKGRWWAVFGRTALIGLVIYGFLLVLLLIAWLLGTLIGENTGTKIMSAIIMGIFLLVYLPYVMCYIAELYHDLDKTKQQPDEKQIQKNKTFLKVFMILGIVGLPLIIGIVTTIAIYSVNNFRKASTNDIPASWQIDDSDTTIIPDDASLENADIPLNGTTQLDEADIEALLQQYQEQSAPVD